LDAEVAATAKAFKAPAVRFLADAVETVCSRFGRDLLKHKTMKKLQKTFASRKPGPNPRNVALEEQREAMREFAEMAGLELEQWDTVKESIEKDLQTATQSALDGDSSALPTPALGADATAAYKAVSIESDNLLHELRRVSKATAAVVEVRERVTQMSSQAAFAAFQNKDDPKSLISKMAAGAPSS
jgi:hypothetical protein